MDNEMRGVFQALESLLRRAKDSGKLHQEYYIPASRRIYVFAILEGIQGIAPDEMLEWFKDSVSVEVGGTKDDPQVEMVWHGVR